MTRQQCPIGILIGVGQRGSDSFGCPQTRGTFGGHFRGIGMSRSLRNEQVASWSHFESRVECGDRVQAGRVPTRE
jgi:hypothetical protein